MIATGIHEIEKSINFDSTEKSLIARLFTSIKYKKGNFFLEEEAICSHVGFITKGIMHYLSSVIKRTEGDVLDISSYFSNRMLVGRATTAYSMNEGTIDSFTKPLAFEGGLTTN